VSVWTVIFGRAVVELYCEHLPLHHESVAAVLSMRLLKLKDQTDWYLEPCT